MTGAWLWMAVAITMGCLAGTTQAMDRQAGAILLDEAFIDAASIDAWTGNGSGAAAIEPAGDDDGVLRVTLEKRGNHMLSAKLPIERIRGRRVTFSAKIKASDVAKPAELWNGVKLMLVTQSPAGPTYTGASDFFGTFDWKNVGRSAIVPADATEASVVIGLQDTSGAAWFDDVTVTITGVPRTPPAVRPAPLPPEKLDRRTHVPRLRGVMYGPGGREEDLRALAGWGGNLIRWQFYSYKMNQPEHRNDLAAYDEFIDETIAELDRFLPLCEELGIQVVIDLHTPPGAMDAGQMTMFRDERCQAKFIEVWDRLAAHFRDKPAIWAYDLLNEPVEGGPSPEVRGWRELAGHVAKRVRAIDPHRAILIAPGPFGGWEDLPFFEPIDVPGIVYTVHLYEPMMFTHQGVLDGMPAGVSYPGEIRGKQWNKDAIREALEPVRQYQLDYNVPIYVGEFSAIRWAPGDSAADYLRDVIEIFEELGWDWSYHAFREWHGWDVEIGPDPNDRKRGDAPNARQTVLRKAFEKNRADRE